MGDTDDTTRRIRALRLRNQGLVPGARPWATAPDVARGMLALQAQDPLGVLFALSVRASERPSEATVVAALDAAEVVRNRPSRGTLQVTAPEDLRWLTGLAAARSNAAAVKRRPQLGVTEEMVEGVGDVLRAQLGGGRVATRPDLVAACAAAGFELDGQQAGHVLRHHTEVMTIVFADHGGRVDSFALADEYLPTRRDLTRDEALAELATRYFDARGPATPQCLGWWANLSMADVRAAIAGAGDTLEQVELGGTTFLVGAGGGHATRDEIDAALAEPLLLPPFDEYLLGYRHRDAIVTPEHFEAVVPGRNGMFRPLVVVDGEIVGRWSRKLTGTTVAMTIELFDDTPAVVRSAATRKGLERRAAEYGEFLGREPVLTVSSAGPGPG
ncbi:MAG: winged helix DNA-binding domain-containing protein [Microthrixaceae bacterium]